LAHGWRAYARAAIFSVIAASRSIMGEAAPACAFIPRNTVFSLRRFARNFSEKQHFGAIAFVDGQMKLWDNLLIQKTEHPDNGRVKCRHAYNR